MLAVTPTAEGLTASLHVLPCRELAWPPTRRLSRLGAWGPPGWTLWPVRPEVRPAQAGGHVSYRFYVDRFP